MQRIIIAIAVILILVIVWFGISAARHEAEKVIEHQVETKIINVVKPKPKVVPNNNEPLKVAFQIHEPPPEEGATWVANFYSEPGEFINSPRRWVYRWELWPNGSANTQKFIPPVPLDVPQQPVRDWNLDVAPVAYSTGMFRWEQQDGEWNWKWYGNPKKQAVSGCANGMCSPHGGGVF